MTASVWKPHVTVAAVVERDGRFLFVEEDTDEGIRINQPAGHLDPDESLLEAAVRETFEETAWRFEPESLVGVYRWHNPGLDRTYLRFAFAGRVHDHDPARALDTGILRTLWLAPGELRAAALRHRSPLVQRCVDDWLAGRRFSLDLLRDPP